MYPRLIFHTCETHDRAINKLCTYDYDSRDACLETFCLTCIKSRGSKFNPNLSKVSTFVCSTCFNLITKQEARQVPLLPFYYLGLKIDDSELVQKSGYGGMEEILKEILGAVTSPPRKKCQTKT